MAPSLVERLDHILDAIKEAKDSTSGITLEEFERNRILRWGTERALEIVSEASRSIPEDPKAQYSITPWRQIADFGNRLRHAYRDVDTLIVWKILQQDLDNLRNAAILMKSNLGEDWE
jgi:uncharacterized protein with HEPN domain